MADFFSLGSSAGTNPVQQQHGLNPPPQTLINPSENWFQSRNEQELSATCYREKATFRHQQWHQDADDDERNNYKNNNQFSTSTLLGFAPTSVVGQSKVVEDQSLPLAMLMMRSSGGVQQGAAGSGDGRRGSINCQDCGNLAKKECVHMRCRTCCNGRGFICQTHVKSTWVPAAKRRERQQQHQQLQIKRIRQDHPSSAPAVSNSSFACSTSSTQLAPSPSALGGGVEVVSRLPPEVRSVAMFKCVRVSPIDQGEERMEQLAYQTSVNIGGHLFRGILYDHGLDTHQQSQHTGGDHISNTCYTHHASYAADPTANVYQAANHADPNSYPTSSAGTHFFQ